MSRSRAADGKVPDGPATQNQLACAIWLAGEKHITLPPHVAESSGALWRWLNATITRIDREDAHATRYDFDLKVDLDNPFSIIGALKYAKEADKKDDIDEAIRLIVFGKAHPYEVEAQLELSASKFNIVQRRIASEYPDFEIDWGSV